MLTMFAQLRKHEDKATVFERRAAHEAGKSRRQEGLWFFLGDDRENCNAWKFLYLRNLDNI